MRFTYRSAAITGREHLAINWAGTCDGWVLQWAIPIPHGYRYEKPLDDGKRFKTKAEAQRRKKEILASL